MTTDANTLGAALHEWRASTQAQRAVRWLAETELTRMRLAEALHALNAEPSSARRASTLATVAAVLHQARDTGTGPMLPHETFAALAEQASAPAVIATAAQAVALAEGRPADGADATPSTDKSAPVNYGDLVGQAWGAADVPPVSEAQRVERAALLHLAAGVNALLHLTAWFSTDTHQ